MPNKAVLVVSFGTTHLDTLEKTIQPIEWDIAARMPGRIQHRAFTSEMILRKLQMRDGLRIDNVPQALERLLEEGITDVVIQPTHIINGDECAKLLEQAAPFKSRFDQLSVGRPLLSSLEDYRSTAAALLEILPGAQPDTAILFMGHGTTHFANSAYCQLEYILHNQGRTDILVGTVEGYPGLEEVLCRLAERPQVKRALLYPLMVVAGDHAKNDLAGEGPDSWRSRLEADGYRTACVLAGLGEYPGIRKLFVRHALDAQ